MFHDTLVIVNLMSLFSVVTTAKILCIFPTPSYSHQAVFRPLVHELARIGHQLYVATTNPSKSNVSNVFEINWDFSYEPIEELVKSASKGMLLKDPLLLWELVTNSVDDFKKKQWTDKKFISVLENVKFDLLIVEIDNKEYYSLKHKLGVPMIGIRSMEISFMEHESMGNPTHPLMYSNEGFGNILLNKNLIERILKVLEYIVVKFIYDQMFMNYIDKVVKEHLITDIQDVWEHDCSHDLVFVNAHPSLGFTRPLVPNFVDISGIHIQPLKNLDEDILKQLNNANNGVILFTLGSTLRSEHLPKKIQDIILDAFAELPFTVILKRPGVIKLPSNVINYEWLQQNEILAHPNVKLFIFQGGYQSMVEAVSHGVPMVAFPFYGDQILNAQRIVHLNIGESINLFEITKESFKRTVLTVINDQKYKENADCLSKKIFDHPQTPLERAVWWTNYVLRHNGTKHLRPVVQNLPLYHFLYLDIMMAWMIFSSMLFLILFSCFKCVCCRQSRNKPL